jgi:hypothetical protein
MANVATMQTQYIRGAVDLPEPDCGRDGAHALQRPQHYGTMPCMSCQLVFVPMTPREQFAPQGHLDV